MKKLAQLYIVMLTLGLNAQIEVTTLTPEFKGSGGLSLDDQGNLIIADFGDFLNISDPDGLPNDIWELDSDLNLNLYSTGFVGASGNDFDSEDILFQSDIGASSIYKIVNGTRTFVTSTGIVNPVGLVFDSNGDFYVCNCGNNTIRKVTPSGVSTQFASGTDFFCPNGITIDEDDNLYVSNFSNGNIIKIDPSGTTTVLNSTPGGTTSGPSNGHLEYHEPTRTLFIASHGSNKIYALRIDDPSNLITIAGTGERGNADGDVSVATFSRPNGVAVTQTGDSIYVNSAVPVTNVPNRPLNPQLVRLITGVNSILGVNDHLTQNEWELYPNPVHDMVTIEGYVRADQYDNLSFKLFDLNGRLILQKDGVEILDSRIRENIGMKKITAGIYLFSLEAEGKQVFNGKIVKQ
ncbi:MAG: T9SS type A sorting domain-containing protein [Bacteroidota bacterium]